MNKSNLCAHSVEHIARIAGLAIAPDESASGGNLMPTKPGTPVKLNWTEGCHLQPITANAF